MTTQTTNTGERILVNGWNAAIDAAAAVCEEDLPGNAKSDEWITGYRMACRENAALIRALKKND